MGGFGAPSIMTNIMREIMLQWRHDVASPSSVVVELAGAFNDWTPHEMERGNDGIYRLAVTVNCGTYYPYKFVIDGRWRSDHTCPTVPDGFGGYNNQLLLLIEYHAAADADADADVSLANVADLETIKLFKSPKPEKLNGSNSPSKLLHVSTSVPALARFGIVADIQYADVEPAWNFAKTTLRRYRQVLEILDMAIEHFNTSGVDMVLNLGDIIDERNRRGGKKMSMAALDQVMDKFSKLPEDLEIVHLIGNHECYNFTRDELRAFLNAVDEEGRGYRSFKPCKDWKCVVLDPYDISTLAYDAEDPRTEEAFKMCEKNNPNRIRDHGVNFVEGLSGEAMRWTPLGGGISQEQLSFLESELEASDSSGEHVIILTHVALHPKTNNPVCVVWNYEDVCEILGRHKSAAAIFAGHDHSGGYYLDKYGIHHITFKSPLNCDKAQFCFAVAELFRDRILIEGFGEEYSRELRLNRKSRWQYCPTDQDTYKDFIPEIEDQLSQAYMRHEKKFKCRLDGKDCVISLGYNGFVARDYFDDAVTARVRLLSY